MRFARSRSARPQRYDDDQAKFAGLARGAVGASAARPACFPSLPDCHRDHLQFLHDGVRRRSFHRVRQLRVALQRSRVLEVPPGDPLVQPPRQPNTNRHFPRAGPSLCARIPGRGRVPSVLFDADRSVLPTAVIVWRVMLSQGGLANGLLDLVGVAPQAWLTSSRLALYSIIAIATWKGASYWMILIVGGLQNISPELYDAARVDGVRPWQRLIFITLPLLRPALLFVLAADVSINFLLFAPIYMLTQGGPAGSTDVLMYEAYKQGFIFGDMGRAMAVVVVIVAILLVVVGLQFRLLAVREQGT